MKKITLGVILMLGSYHLAVASPLYQFPSDSLSDSFNNHQKDLALQCTDFTGYWEGTCVSKNGDQFPHSHQVHQDGCELLRAYGVILPIGGMMTVTTMKDQSYGASSTLSADWKDNRTVLELVQAGVLRFLGKSPEVSSQETKSNIRIENQKLIHTIKDKNDDLVMECNYVKKAMS